MKIYELKGLQMYTKCVPTDRILYIGIPHTYRNSATWLCVGSLVQCGNSVHDMAYPLTSMDLPPVFDGSAICF